MGLALSASAWAQNEGAMKFEPIGGKPPPLTDSWVEGKFGKGVQFAGVSDSINCGHDASLKISDQITIAFWINAKTWVHCGGFICKLGSFEISKRSTDDASGLYFNFMVGGTIRGMIWDPSNHMKLERDKWQHIAFTYDSGTAVARSYLNGRPHSMLELKKFFAGLLDYRLRTSDGDLLIGTSEGSFYGKLDEIYIFKRVLSTGEVAQLYQNEQVSRTGLVGQWSFEEGKGTEVADLSGNGNTGHLHWQYDICKLPKLGGEVVAPVLFSGSQMDLWFQNATAKVMHGDKPAPRKADPVITVSMAKNESEPFQVVIAPKVPLKGVQVSFTDLTNGSRVIPKESISWNLVEYVAVDKPSDTSIGTVPGGEVPIIYTQKGEPGWYPDPLPEVKRFDVKEERNYPIWVTVRTPKDIPAGVYQGKMRLAPVDTAPVELTFKVNVWNFGLPEVFHTRNQCPFRTHYGSMDAQKAARNIAEHGFAIDPIMTPPVLTFKGTEAFIDTAKFDQTAAYLINDLKMNNFFFPLLGMYFMPDARNAVGGQWHGFTFSDKPGVLREDFLAALTSYIHKMSDHLRQKGWFDKFRVSLVDEPHAAGDFAIIRQASKAIKKVEPNIKIYETKWPKPELIGDVDIWCLTLFQLGPMKAALDRKELLEWYPNWHPLIDRPGMNTRMAGWIMWKHQITGLLLFASQSNWFPGDPKATWRRPRFVYPSGSRTMWGMGCLLYPADDWNPVNSIRWELFRESFEDYEYLYLLNSLCKELSSKTLDDQQAEILKEGRNCLTELPDQIVPYYEAYDDQEKWKRMAWELGPDKVYEARAKIAGYIERLTEIRNKVK